MCWWWARTARAAAEAAAKLDGVAEVLLADGPSYAHRLAEPVAALGVALATDYDTLVAPSTAVWKSVLPRIAALLDVMQVSDVIGTSSAPTPSTGRSMPATPSSACVPPMARRC